MAYIWDPGYEGVTLYLADGSEWGSWTDGTEFVSIVKGKDGHANTITLDGYDGYFTQVDLGDLAGDYYGAIYAPLDDLQTEADPAGPGSLDATQPKKKTTKTTTKTPKKAAKGTPPSGPPPDAAGGGGSGLGWLLLLGGGLAAAKALK